MVVFVGEVIGFVNIFLNRLVF